MLRTLALAGCLAIVSGALVKTTVLGAPIDIGNRRELFVDRHLVERAVNVLFRLHPPLPQELSLEFDQPWERWAPGYVTVFRDVGVFRMYYRCVPAGSGRDEDENQLTCYAESPDGIKWHRPELGLHEFAGSKRNNIVWRGIISHNFTPFVDSNPASLPNQRFKAVGGVKHGGGLFLLVSPDGIRWSRAGDKPLAFPGNFDSQNVIFWDPSISAYRAYWRDGRRGHPDVADGRDVKTSRSTDLNRWTEPRWLDYEPSRSGSVSPDWADDPTGDHHQYYTNGIQLYERAPHLLLGLPNRYSDRGWTASSDFLPDLEARRELAANSIKGGHPTRLGTAITDILFMASRDGQKFHVWPEALVRPGIQRPGTWFYGGTWCSYGMVETPSTLEGAPTELSLYITEGSDRRKVTPRIRRHTLRLDGFASAYATLDGGEIVTKPLRFSGTQLEINFSSSGGGTIRVEVQDEKGNSIPGLSLNDCHVQYGDQHDRRVTWKSASVAELAGKTVRLRYYLRDADLFSFRFAP